MAIVGKTSPFSKKSSKDSPLKFAQFIPLVSAGLSYLSSRKAGKDAKRADSRNRQEMAEMREKYEALEFSNPYEGLKTHTLI